jgi:F0F1-type ATP synthase assembly protein I
MFAHFIALTEQGTAKSLSVAFAVFAQIEFHPLLTGYFQHAKELIFSQKGLSIYKSAQNHH